MTTVAPQRKHNDRKHASPHHEVPTDEKQIPIRPIIIIIIVIIIIIILLLLLLLLLEKYLLCMIMHIFITCRRKKVVGTQYKRLIYWCSVDL